MIKVSEKLTLLNRSTIKSLLLLILTSVFLFGCEAQDGKTQTVNSDNTEIKKPTNSETPDFSRLDDSKYLSQSEAKDINALLKRYREADENEKNVAVWLIKESDKDIKRKWYIVGSEGYGESIIVFPTVEAMLKQADAVTKIDTSIYPTKKESFEQINRSFRASMEYFELAEQFAKETGQEKKLELFPDLKNKIFCVKMAVENLERARKECPYIEESVRESLRRKD